MVWNWMLARNPNSSMTGDAQQYTVNYYSLWCLNLPQVLQKKKKKRTNLSNLALQFNSSWVMINQVPTWLNSVMEYLISLSFSILIDVQEMTNWSWDVPDKLDLFENKFFRDFVFQSNRWRKQPPYPSSSSSIHWTIFLSHILIIVSNALWWRKTEKRRRTLFWLPKSIYNLVKHHEPLNALKLLKGDLKSLNSAHCSNFWKRVLKANDDLESIELALTNADCRLSLILRLSCLH